MFRVSIKTFHHILFLLLYMGLWPPALAQNVALAPNSVSLRSQIAAKLRVFGFTPPYRDQLKELYELRGGHLVWLRNGMPTPAAREMIGVFTEAATKGLAPRDYDAYKWEGRLKRLALHPSADEMTRFDVEMSVAALRYVSDLHQGRVDPISLHFFLGRREQPFSLAFFVYEHLVSHPSQIASAMASIEPQYPGYRRTLAALARYRVLEARPYTQLSLPRKTVVPGKDYPGLLDVCERLAILGDLPEPAMNCASHNVYRGSIVEAVKHFQLRHGLSPTGNLDRATIVAMNVPPARRVEQLELTLERWRWVPRHLSGPMIVVNIPEFQLHAIDAHYHWVFSQKIVVGRAYRHKTPVFVGEMSSIIFRPYWNVPLSIQRSELLKDIEKDPNYLSRHDYEIVNRAQGRSLGSRVTPQILTALRSGTLAVRQRPGDQNALGLIKFDFPNQFDVYMHGTPATALFARSRRDFSHGCIRVEDPAALAAWILRDTPSWTPQAIQNAMHGEDNHVVPLSHPLTVVIIYGTAVVQENGTVSFLPDIYGYDAALKEALLRRHRGQ